MKVAHWIIQLDEVTQSFTNDFGKLTQDELNWKTNANQWSVAQNIHHLITVNESYYPILKSLHAQTYSVPWIGKIEFITRFIGKSILDATQPDRRKRSTTFPIWEPTNSTIEGDILNRFVNHQDELKQAILGSQDFIDNHVVISSPANKIIVYKLETAFNIIVAHEKRHLEQAREVKNNQFSV